VTRVVDAYSLQFCTLLMLQVSGAEGLLSELRGRIQEKDQARLQLKDKYEKDIADRDAEVGPAAHNYLGLIMECIYS
jgi:hypothetical protein